MEQRRYAIEPAVQDQQLGTCLFWTLTHCRFVCLVGCNMSIRYCFFYKKIVNKFALCRKFSGKWQTDCVTLVSAYATIFGIQRETKAVAIPMLGVSELFKLFTICNKKTSVQPRHVGRTIT